MTGKAEWGLRSMMIPLTSFSGDSVFDVLFQIPGHSPGRNQVCSNT